MTSIAAQQVKAPQRYTVTDEDVFPITVDFQRLLDSGDTLTGTPTVSEVTSSDLTLGTPSINTSATTIDIPPKTSPADQSITFSVQGQQANTEYNIKTKCGTANGHTRVIVVGFDCVDADVAV